MVYKNLCILVLWTKVALTLGGLLYTQQGSKYTQQGSKYVFFQVGQLHLLQPPKGVVYRNLYIFGLPAEIWGSHRRIQGSPGLQAPPTFKPCPGFRPDGYLVHGKTPLPPAPSLTPSLPLQSIARKDTSMSNTIDLRQNALTLMLLVADLANTKWCKNLENDRNPGTWVLLWEYSASAFQWVPTWLGLYGFQISLHTCAFDESSLSWKG